MSSKKKNEQLQSVFDDLRQRYFPGRLRGYRVRWGNFSGTHMGQCDSKTRTLSICRGLKGDELIATLLHEMNHVGCPSHGKRFRQGIERLIGMGAPIDESDKVQGVSPVTILTDCMESLAMEMPDTKWSLVKASLARELGMTQAEMIRRYPWARRRWEKDVARYGVYAKKRQSDTLHALSSM